MDSVQYHPGLYSVEHRYAERMRRTYQILHSYNPELAAEVFNQSKPKVSVETMSAIKIQAAFRGFSARKQYTDLLYERYIEDERRQQDIEMRRMEEGLLMLENLQLEAKLEEKLFLNRQHIMERAHAATVIQRSYRRHKHLPTPLAVMPKVVERHDAIVFKEPPPESSHPKPAVYQCDILTPALLDTFNCSGWLDTPLFSLTSPRRGLNITAECDDILKSINVAESDCSDDETENCGKQHNVSYESDCPPEPLRVDESRLIIGDFPMLLQKPVDPEGGDFSMTLYKKKNAPTPKSLMQLDYGLLDRLDHQELAEHAYSLWKDAQKLSLELEEVLENREDLRENQALQHRIIEHLLKACCNVTGKN